jgi:hypothetical protein
MSTVDLSRNATDLRKRYDGVRMQQGRVLTDDCFNEAEVLAAEDLRRTRLDTIGAYGANDAGFQPKDFAVVADLGLAAPGKPSFKLSAGTIYLGGLRVEMPADEYFHLQKDWLEFDAAADWPAAPAPGTSRIDLVWLEAWRQPVTAIEDSELFEVALGGADTSTRERIMRRVQVMPNVGTDDCPSAWAAAKGSFAALGTMAPDMELATAAKLRVSYTVPPNAADLCSPPTPGGYLGALNQAIRVQLVSATHYTWGFDNAAPVYRVKIQSKGGQRIVVKMLNVPKDAAHWPLAQQVAEILPWSAALANGETVADLAGHFSKVSVSYNPDDQTFELVTQVPAGFGERWKLRSDKGDFFDGSAQDDYLFLRLWNRGDDLTSPALIPVASGALGNTGFQVQFIDGPLRANDYWIIAARPATPDQVVPWLLEATGGAAIHGVRRYRAPLGLIEWTATLGGPVTGKLIHDCRPPFLPLTKIRGCCSVSVGDGTHSFGQFTSINAAIASLPVAGGTVCVLPGLYEESVVIDARKNITVHGCGPRSRIVASTPADGGVAQPAVRITASSDITIESLALVGGMDAAVVHVEADSAYVRIAENLIQVRDERGKATPWPALFTRGDKVLIEDNVIEIEPDENLPADRIQLALAARGGLQIGGGSDHVVVRRNRITGGIGHGIVLGSLLKKDGANPDGILVVDVDTTDECASCEPNDSIILVPLGPLLPHYESAGDLYDIEIHDNEILRHGANGIGVVRFFALLPGNIEMIAVHGLTIRDNRILFNLRRPVAVITGANALFVGYGGIVLAVASGLRVIGNDIIGNGIDWRSPVSGVFALRVDGLEIEHNRIGANGRRGEVPVSGTQVGMRAGIHIWSANSAVAASGTKFGLDTASSFAVAGIRGEEQIRVHANQVLQPLGRALFIIGRGPMLITDNRLVSQAAGRPATDPFADAAFVINAGFSKEWTLLLLATLVLTIYLKIYNLSANYAQWICFFSKLAIFSPPLANRGPTGKITFNDNHVSFLMDDRVSDVSFALSSVLLLSLDDVSANDNAFEHHDPRRIVMTDLFALGFSVRASDNRLAETWGRAALSLLSLGLMTTVADNQSTHCIRAFGLKTAVHDNLVLAETFCSGACSNKNVLLIALLVGALALTKQP